MFQFENKQANEHAHLSCVYRKHALTFAFLSLSHICDLNLIQQDVRNEATFNAQKACKASSTLTLALWSSKNIK